MRIYVVKHPDISADYRTLTNKSIELLSGEVLEENDSTYKVLLDTNHTYCKRHKKWEDVGIADKFNWIRKDHTNISCTGYSCYTTLEGAVAAKLILLGRLQDDVESKLAQIRDSLLASAENVDELLEAHKDQYPEFFM